MSAGITGLMVTKFLGNLELAVQNSTAPLEDCVTVETGLEGDLVTPVSYVDPLIAQKLTTRHGDTEYANTTYSRRWYEPTAYTLADLFDWADVLKVTGDYDPKSPVVKAFVAGLKRAQTDRVLAAYFSSAKTGVKGGSTESFDTSNQQVALATGGPNSGMNVAKLKDGLQILQQNEIEPDDEIYCLLTARQNKELLKEIEVINGDYARLGTIIEKGRVMYHMGINFKHVQFDQAEWYPDGKDALINASSNYLLPMWVKSGMALGKWKDIDAKMDIMPGKNYSTQIWSSTMVGATRTDNKRVVQIICYGS